jgi:hypothetical protein
MRRFLVLWLWLTITLGITSLAVSVALFRHLDLGYSSLVQLLIIPSFQAAVVSWVGQRWSFSEIAWVARESVRHWLIVLIVLLDVLLLLVGLVSDGQSVLARVVAQDGQLNWAAVKLLVAGAIFIVVAVRSKNRLAHRMWVTALAVCLLSLALEAFVPWLRLVPDSMTGVGSEVVRWSLSYGGAWTVVMILLITTGSVLKHGSRLAAVYLDGAAACLFMIGLIFPLNFFLRPFLMAPWEYIVMVLASLGATACLGASILAVSSSRRRPGPEVVVSEIRAD